MTREEKIEIMFESILAEVERIGKTLDGKDLKKVQKGSQSLEEKMDTLSERILDIRIPMPKVDQTPVLNKLDELIKEFHKGKSANTKEGIPSIKWFENITGQGLKSSSWFLIMAVILLTSLGVNIYFMNVVPPLNETQQKYEFIYHSGNQEYLDQLDSLWEIDSIRARYIRFIDEENFTYDKILK